MKKIALHSVPRSGSTWLGQILNSSPSVKYAYQPLFSYTFKSYLDEQSSKERITQFFNEIVNSDDPFINQSEDVNKNLIPTFEKLAKTKAVVYKELRYHYILQTLLEQTDDVKVIGLVRNPLSVINSWLRAPREFREDLGWNKLEEWNFAKKKNQDKKEEYNGFQKWKETTILFENLQKKYPNRFLLVVYNDLIKDVNKTVQQIFDFCDIELTEQTLSFINSNKVQNDKDAYSVFKQVRQDRKWESQLNKEIINNIKIDLKDHTLKNYIADGI
tara:strand:+ start:425 stop:1243 length:819 start_codon:yes stop_codon:yes gene_type:complete